MKTLLWIVLVITSLVFCTPALAQKGNLEKPFQFDARSLVFPEPYHETVIIDPEKDLWVTPPPPCTPVPGRVCPPTTPASTIDFLSASAKTNGVNTWLDLNFSKDSVVFLAKWVVFFDTDQNPKTGEDAGFSTDERTFDPGIGYDAVIFSDDFGANVCGPDECRFIPAKFGEHTIKLMIPNELLGAYAGGDMNFALMVGDEDGVTDVAPNEGFATVTSTVNAKLSPGDSQLTTSQMIDLSVIVQLDDPFNTAVRKLVTFDGVDVTGDFEKQQVEGTIQAMGYYNPEQNGITRSGKSYRYRIQPGTLQFGRHVLETLVFTGRGLAYSQVEWIVMPGREGPIPTRP